MMNIRGIANSVIQQVNANIQATWKRSTGGYATNSAGHREPIITTETVKVQVQGTTSDDLKQIDGLNIQGVMRKVFMYGNVQGVVRTGQKGGDILAFPDAPGAAAKDWRVVHVLESWPTWCSVIVVMQ